MTDTADKKQNLAELASLSHAQVVAALERDDDRVMDAVTQLILEYSEKTGELLKQGKDYLPLLTPTAATLPIEAVAMSIVLEAIEEEVEEAENS